MVTLEIALALAVLTVGHCLAWRSRDNVVAYVQVATLVVTVLIPLFGTDVLDSFAPDLVGQFADTLALGAAAYLGGVVAGAYIGGRSRHVIPFTFEPAIAVAAHRLVVSRARLLGLAGVGSLVVAYRLLGYVPLLAIDRKAAKFGIGIYRAGFERGSIAYHLALALAAAVLPVVLVVAYRQRRPRDVALAAALGVGLALSLSRSVALSAPVIVTTALLISWRRRTGVVVAVLVALFVAGGAATTLLGTEPARPGVSLAGRLAETAPDLRDQLLFLRGFELADEHTQGRTILAGLSLRESRWDPATYALRTATGIQDLTEFASGGLRLSVPVWGHASFGPFGVVVMSWLSGFLAAWGMAKLRRVMTRRPGEPADPVVLVLAAVFYNGTFAVLAAFYFPTNASLVAAAVALGLGLYVRVRSTAAGTLQPEYGRGTADRARLS